MERPPLQCSHWSMRDSFGRPPLPSPAPEPRILQAPGSLRWSSMTPPTVIPAPGAGSEVGPVQVRLGPSAAARCRRRIHLDAAAGGRRTMLSTAARRALDDLAEHRELVIEQLRTAHGIAALALTPEPDGPPGRDESGPPGEKDMTWRSTRAPIVLTPEMTTATRSGAADLLVWAGDGYLPVIIRVHRTRDRGAGAPISSLAKPLEVRPDPTHRIRRNRADRLTLAHHYRQLEALNCASATARGGVIGRGSPTDGAGRPDTIGGEDDGSVIVWHDLDGTGSSTLHDYDDRFDDRLAVAAAAVTGARPLAWPSRVAECRRCPWWARCGPELHASADISLLLSGGRCRGRPRRGHRDDPGARRSGPRGGEELAAHRQPGRVRPDQGAGVVCGGRTGADRSAQRDPTGGCRAGRRRGVVRRGRGLPLGRPAVRR